VPCREGAEHDKRIPMLPEFGGASSSDGCHACTAVDVSSRYVKDHIHFVDYIIPLYATNVKGIPDMGD
jgi:hypothetical protein